MEAVALRAGRRMLSKNAQGYEAADPVYEAFVDSKGRSKKRKRALPAGLSKHDARILQQVRRRAHTLDTGFSMCGINFGWTAVLGLIPIVGDLANALLGYRLVVVKAQQCDGGLPLALVQRMLFNSLVALSVGIVPLVGDVVAAVWKANSRNSALLEAFLIARAEKGEMTAPSASSIAPPAIRTPAVPTARASVVEGSERTTSKSKSPKWYGWGKE